MQGSALVSQLKVGLTVSYSRNINLCFLYFLFFATEKNRCTEMETRGVSVLIEKKRRVYVCVVGTWNSATPILESVSYLFRYTKSLFVSPISIEGLTKKE